MSPALDADQQFDLLRGIAAYTGSPLVGDIARLLARTGAPEVVHAMVPEMAVAFNHKQIASKLWLLSQVHAVLGARFGDVAVLGGWLGVLSGMLLNDPHLSIGRVVSLDLDPACAPVAMELNRRFAEAGRFTAVTGNMLSFDYAGLGHAGLGYSGLGAPALVINTSTEHLPDPGAWRRRLPGGLLVAAQSNNYRAVPEHLSCVDSAAELADRLALERVLWSGDLVLPRYTRFMVIGVA